MANTLKNTIDKIGDVVEEIMTTKRAPTIDSKELQHSQTCLEQLGMETRHEHLFRNEWKRDLQYTKALVESEYAIQTEFKVSSYEDLLLETSKQDYANGLRQQKNKLEQRLEAIETSTKPKENLSKR